jgi:hypothetical protein
MREINIYRLRVLIPSQDSSYIGYYAKIGEKEGFARTSNLATLLTQEEINLIKINVRRKYPDAEFENDPVGSILALKNKT